MTFIILWLTNLDLEFRVGGRVSFWNIEFRILLNIKINSQKILKIIF